MQKIAALQQFAARHDLLYRCDAPAGTPSDCYVYSHDMQYRYAFARWWSAEGPLVLWVGVNPGKGDTEHRRRPTLERCIGWSSLWWGAGGLMFANLFASRHNRPTLLRHTADPVGPHNDAALTAMSAIADHTVVAWGNWGRLNGRAGEIAGLLSQPLCLGVTATGQPRHPLYLPRATAATLWSEALAAQRGVSQTLGVAMVSFDLRLENSYWSKGFFNVSVDFQRFVTTTDGPIDVFRGDSIQPVAGRVDRTSNRNATPRIFGNKPLAKFFQANYERGGLVRVEIISPSAVRVGGGSGAPKPTAG